MKAYVMHTAEDRALSESDGSQLLIKKANGKYSLFIPVEGTGEIGSTPQLLDKTAIGNKQASNEEGRTENPQITVPFYAHRDNTTILEELKGQSHDFLRLLPDFTGYKFSGKVNYKLNDTGLNALEQGEVTITPTTGNTYINNCIDLVEDSAVITNAIPKTLEIKGVSSESINVETEPVGATISAESDTTGAATVAVEGHKVTITGVAKGSAIITIKSTNAGYADFKRSILVVVTE